MTPEDGASAAARVTSLGSPLSPQEARRVASELVVVDGSRTSSEVDEQMSRRVLNDGGVVRFIHKDGWAILITADGESFQALDGRAYAGFLRTRATKLTRTESGSIESGDLIIEWRR